MYVILRVLLIYTTFRSVLSGVFDLQRHQLQNKFRHITREELGLHTSGLQSRRPFGRNLIVPNLQQSFAPIRHLGISDPTFKNLLNSEIHHKNTSTQEFPEFGYEGHLGPELWPFFFPNCNGVYQSPIALGKRNTKLIVFETLKTSNYDVFPEVATITNNGHTVQVTIPDDGATIKGGGLTAEYMFLNFHFHWGSNSKKGSEHIIDGISYPLELHLVHWNLNFPTTKEAMQSKDGIAVLAVLFHVEPIDNPYLQPIVETLDSVIRIGTNKTFVPRFRLSDFIPEDKRDYYRYYGSLTTPNCEEVVIWTVFSTTLPISERQLSDFRRLLGIENDDRTDNHRPVQPLNGRLVYKTI